MRPTRPAAAPVIRIEPDNEWAWCGERRLELTPKAFAVLRHLVERPQQLVTKGDLLDAVWRDTIVSDAALASCIRDVRRALRDASARPRYIETVHRRGFRFIGPVAGSTIVSSAASRGPAHAVGAFPVAKSTLVGRAADLARLHEGWATAQRGRRHLVFVTGEAGIGKTALVEAFLAEVGAAGAPRVGRGQCVEQYGAGEAYLPVLEALGRLGVEPGDARLVDVLRQYAPTWLVQLPALLADRDLDAVQRRAQGATRERMLRELVEALDALGTESPLVLVLEDLHWSDTATVDLLAMLARRRDAARLLVIGTYRPADVAQSAHHLRSVKRELDLHGHCEEIALAFLDVAAVAEYLDRRFGPAQLPADLAPALYRSTDGNPLFLVNTVDSLIAQGHIRDAGGGWELAVPVAHVTAGAPESLAQMVERQLERMTPPERAVLPVVSVAGAEFSAAVATADGLDQQEAERVCEELARRGQFLRAVGVAEWPDGTAVGRYAFIHALYQEVLYAGVPAGRRAGLHLRIGECLERGHGERAGDIAGELAVHFERGRDTARAIRYRRLAGDAALRHHGYLEAAEHARRALDLLAGWPDGPAREHEELPLRMMLGSALAATQGFAGSEVAGIYARARELCAHAGDDPSLFPVLLGLGRFHNIRGEVAIARDVGRRLLSLADGTRDSAMRLAAHNGLGIMAFFGGELEAALDHLDEGARLYDPERHSPARSAVFRAGQDAGVSCLVYAAWTLLLLGYPERADARMREALALARSLEHPFSLAYACHFGAAFHGCRREREVMQALEDEASRLSTEYGFRLFVIAGAIHREWLASGTAHAEERVARMRDGIAAWRAIGAELRTPAFLAALAEVCRDAERPEDGLRAVADGLTAGDETGQHYWDAELYRLRAELGLRSDPASETAEADLREAIEAARRQRAKWWELRAATSLCRLWAERGETARAHAWLSDVYHWFTEGFNTADVADARALLDRLAGACPLP